MADAIEAPVFEGVGQFAWVSVEECALLYRYMRNEGMINEVVERGTSSDAASGVFDESHKIDDLCGKVKQLTGDSIAKGFSNSVHILKFLNGDCGLPEPVKDDGGSAPVLIAA